MRDADGPGGPTLFCLHFLGGSARSWAQVAGRLAPRIRCVAIDLPGFGDAAQSTGYSVAEMADHVAAVIRADGAASWMLAGHSMGAKVAAVLARRAEDGADGLGGLAGLVLVAGSPPGPEPMAESQRQAMIGWFSGDAGSRRADADSYIDQNSTRTLASPLAARAVDDVLRTKRAAWVAWLENGSREDWSARVGVVGVPALVIAGADDADLGPEAQLRLMAPHFSTVRLVTLPEAGHLLPLECPDEVARLIAAHAAEFVPPGAPVIDAPYRALIGSDRVSARTREILRARAAPDDPAYRPAAMDDGPFAVLRAVLDRVVPQPGTMRIDLAARIDRQLAAGTGDGWRFALLPPDAEAYRAALATLDHAARVEHGRDFVALDDAAQDALLSRAADETLGGRLDARQMRLWFEDLRSDAVRHYVSHPATMARMGYGGIGYGGDGAGKRGFVRIGAGERDDWEPDHWEPAARPAS